MTESGRFKAEEKISKLGIGIYSAVLLIAVMLMSVLLADELGGYVKIGIELALKRVIPTALPFMIISDIVSHYAKVEYIPALATTVANIFGVPRQGLTPIIIGNICGFPLGGKATSEMYIRGEIEKDMGERLLAYSSNPSPSFIVGAVGIGLFGSMKIGLLLLFSTYISTIVAAQFFRKNHGETLFSHNNTRQRFNFVASIKNAGEAAVSISSFIIIFACISGIVEKHISIAFIKEIIISVLEVTGAVNFFALTYENSPNLALPIVAFSLGFGGFSVLAQTAAFANEAGLSMKKYTIIKLLEGGICAVICAITYYIFL